MTAGALLADAGPYEKMVSFEISSSDLDQAMNRASRQISRQVNIAGFRPGKAPRRLVENQVGFERIRADALEELVPHRVGEILSETEIAPVVPPLLESVTDGANGSVRVEVRVTTWPRLESVPDYRGRTVKVRTLPPVSVEVESRIQELRQMYAPLQTVDRAAEEGYFVVFDMTAWDVEHSFESLALDGFSYEVGSETLNARIDEGLLGHVSGDEISISAPLPEWLSSQADTADGGGLSEAGEDSEASEGSDGEPPDALYRIRIVEVQARSLPDLDDAWASEYTGHDSLEDLRQEMGGELEPKFMETQWSLLTTETLAELASDLELDLPERLESAQMELQFRRHLSFLERLEIDHTTYLKGLEITNEQFLEELRAQAVTSLKSRILIEAVVDSEDLVVDDAELAQTLEEGARESEDPEAFLQHMEESDHPERIRSDMLIARAQAFLAMQIQPVDDEGQPVEIEPPSWVRAWFEPTENPETEGGSAEAVYEAEVINDPDPD
ncbi:MAG: trigger factor [Acidimicrobiia bacterium]|nr:trigger factor [Acidimicrobiia bacterium]